MPMPLSMASQDENVRLIEIRGGKQLKQRLADMGLNPGTTVRVMATNGEGPLILDVKDTRLAIGRRMAHKILVEPTDQPERRHYRRFRHRAHRFRGHHARHRRWHKVFGRQKVRQDPTKEE